MQKKINYVYVHYIQKKYNNNINLKMLLYHRNAGKKSHPHNNLQPYNLLIFFFFSCSDPAYSGGNITFSLLTPEPNQRPGYNDFYNNPALQKMAHATQVRIHLSGQYHTGAAGVNQRHRYYAINEITISGR